MDINNFYSRTDDKENKEHLNEHIEKTRMLAEKFALDFNSSAISSVEASLHDIGKATSKFQNVLSGKETKIDHAIVGAIVANEHYSKISPTQRKLICASIASHHGDLYKNTAYSQPPYDLVDYIITTNGKRNALSNEQEYIDIVQMAKDENLFPEISNENFLDLDTLSQNELMFYQRMLFSCLIDADFTASASFSEPDVLNNLETCPDFDKMLKALDEYRNDIIKNTDQKLLMNQIRQRVYEEAGHAGIGKKAFYTLTAPTGSAKTLALMYMALLQAKSHKMKRIFIILPYLSIISQNAQIYRDIFGEEAVLEIDSQTEYSEETKELADRWNAPIIITTSKTFFETLFASKNTELRKLHNVANSVIVFDECQTLNDDLIDTTTEIVQQLVDNYGCTILYSTATQPSYKYRKNITPKYKPIEVISNSQELFNLYKIAKNTKLQFDAKTFYSPETLFEKFQTEKQILYINNTVKKARKLYEVITKSNIYANVHVFLLTSEMCSQHKLDTIKAINSLLKEYKTCIVCATQCVEAGVDFDFPIVAREFAPWTSISQSAGRANRNGMGEGRVFIFMHEDHSRFSYPNTSYFNASNISVNIAKKEDVDIYDLEIMEEYYKLLYSQEETKEDRFELIKSINEENYIATAENYSLIDTKSQFTVIVPYPPFMSQFDEIRNKVHKNNGLTKKEMASCRKFTVNKYSDKDLKNYCTKVNLLHKGETHETNWYILENKSLYTKHGLNLNESKGGASI